MMTHLHHINSTDLRQIISPNIRHHKPHQRCLPSSWSGLQKCPCVSGELSVCVSAQPGAGHPLRLSIQLVDESEQLAVSFVQVRVDDDGVEQVAAALLHLPGLLDDVPQLLGLRKTNVSENTAGGRALACKSGRTETFGFLLSFASRARSRSWEGGAMKMM